MVTLADIQGRLLEQDKVLSIDVEVFLPRIGGYNARPYSSEIEAIELPRPSEIKALWRWWMRVILSGIYGGGKKYDELNKEIDKILGSTEMQSIFSVIITTDSPIDQMILEKTRFYEELILQIIPRVVEKLSEKLRSKASLKIRLSLPILIELTLRNKQTLEDVKQLFIKEFGISLSRGRRFLEVKASIDSGEQLLNIMENLGIRTTIPKEEIKETYEKLVRIGKIPRLKILIQPRKEDDEDSRVRGRLNERNKKYLKRVAEDIAPLAALVDVEKIPLKIIITTNRRDINEKTIRFAVASLFLSLLLGATGSITRRGFGSINIKNIEISKKYGDLIKEEVESVTRIIECEKSNALKDELSKYIQNNIINLFKEIYNIKSINLQFPEVPSLIPNYFKLEVIECGGKNSNVVELLEAIGNATLKVKWKLINGLNPRSAGGSLHTWILGLPRQSRERRLDTGYYVRSEEEKPGRRPSAIYFKIFENKGGKRFIIIYGFLSRDWPVDELVHKGIHYPQGKNLRELGFNQLTENEIISQVFEQAFKTVCGIVKNELGGTQRKR